MSLYRRLCQKTKQRHEPCVIDVFMSITEFMRGEPAQPWWAYTDARKRMLKHAADDASRD